MSKLFYLSLLSASLLSPIYAKAATKEVILNGLNQCEKNLKLCNKSCDVTYDFYTEPVEYRKCLITCDKEYSLCLNEIGSPLDFESEQ